MAKVTFSGDPNPVAKNPPTAEFHGITFPLGKPIEAPEDVAKKLSTHSHFTVESNLGDFDGDGEAGGSAAAVSGLKAIHKGRGKYVITDGTGIVKEGLTKADADQFNALSDDDKAGYVA